MEPLTAGITAYGASGAAGGGAASAGGAALLSNPITAAILLAAAGTAYGTSPTVRDKVNGFAHDGWEKISNPFQHFGDGSDKDKFGNLQRGIQGRVSSLGGMPGMGEGTMDSDGGGLQNLLAQGLGKMGQQKDQKKQNNQQQGQNMSLFGDGLTPPLPNPMINTTFQYAPPSPLNPLPPLFGKPERGLYGPY